MAGKESAGATLHELVMSLVIVGILAALAAPRMERMMAVVRTRGAVNRLAADLAYTRQLAARSGQRARLAVERSSDCPAAPGGWGGYRYRIVRGGPDSVVVVRNLRVDDAPICVWANGSGPVTFRSSGLLAGFNNRTIVVRQEDNVPDTLTLSVVGRVRRRY
jgi:Tfp pilus assembly protein FimT